MPNYSFIPFGVRFIYLFSIVNLAINLLSLDIKWDVSSPSQAIVQISFKIYHFKTCFMTKIRTWVDITNNIMKRNILMYCSSFCNSL